MEYRFLIVSLLFCFGVTETASPLSCEQVQTVVNRHNQRRLLLAKGQLEGQPAASEMKYMIWDDELAAKATKWAANHKLAHNPDTSVGSNRFRTGENIYSYKTTNKKTKFNFEKGMNAWFKEHNNYSYGPLTKEQFNSKKMIGHYTQMVWSNSVYLGCGLSEVMEDKMKAFYFVCNYGPSGNIIGTVPYPSNGTASGDLLCSTGDCDKAFGDRC